ncbi:MAG: hypothetical protein R3321_13700 [Nitrososphaeraceae archaeon]|nr:hypothetical protein [Nitrososphaeraceae archaeon]
MIKIDNKGNIWYQVSSIKEIKTLLDDYNFRTHSKNINEVIDSIDAWLNEYIYENGSLDSNIIKNADSCTLEFQKGKVLKEAE